MDNWLEEIHFVDLVKDDKSVAGLVLLLSTDFKSNRMMSHKHSLAAMYSWNQNGGLQSQILGFFRITSLLKAENLSSGKAECLLAIGEDKECKVFGTTLSFEGLSMLDHFDFQIGHSRVVICLCQNESLRKSIYEHEKVFHLQVSFSCK